MWLSSFLFNFMLFVSPVCPTLPHHPGSQNWASFAWTRTCVHPLPLTSASRPRTNSTNTWFSLQWIIHSLLWSRTALWTSQDNTSYVVLNIVLYLLALLACDLLEDFCTNIPKSLHCCHILFNLFFLKHKPNHVTFRVASFRGSSRSTGYQLCFFAWDTSLSSVWSCLSFTLSLNSCSWYALYFGHVGLLLDSH